jgi:pantothenate kinase
VTTQTLQELADRARALATDGGRAVLGITGAPGAGKTTLVEALLAELAPTPPEGAVAEEWVAHVPMDGFHLADVQLDRLGRRERKGAADTFDVEGYLSSLRRVIADDGTVVYAPGFERTLEQPVAASIAVLPEARLVLTEGNYLLLPERPWSKVRTLVDEVWFVDVPESERLARLVARHVRFGKKEDDARAWATGPDQRNAEMVRAARERADLVVRLDEVVPPRPTTPTA